MRRLLILNFFLVIALPAWPAKRVSVAQLEKTLNAASAAHKADVDLARQISVLEPSERISDATLNRLTKQFAARPQTLVALQLLADKSSFLPLPPSELPSIAAPDAAAQQQQLEAARKYAFGMLPRLPNLLAARTTYSFNDSPQELEKGGWGEQLGLHLVGISKAEVSVLNERSNLPVKESASSPAPNGLLTWGEFGSALLLILSDSAHGKTNWSHWEQTAAGPVSVFDYAVPRSASHYEIATPVDEAEHGGSSRWWRSGGVLSANAPSASKLQRSTPAYHGSLWIDPATGTILRVSLIADLSGNSSLERAAVLVEYGPVHIQDKTFICPLRSLALSTAPGSVVATIKGAVTEWLNENLFSGYHIFASTARILPERADSSSPETPPEQTDSKAAAFAALQPATPPSPAPEPNAELPVDPQSSEHAAYVAPANQPFPDGIPAAWPPRSSPETPPPPGRDAASTLRLDVNVVLVPVVVRDRDGNVVGDLQKQDFEVLDNGKPRPLSGFLVENHALPPNPPSAAISGSPAAVAPASPQAGSTPTTLPGRITVFVFDDMNMDFEEIAHAQKAASKIFDQALTGTDMAAVVSTSGKVNSGITRDQAKLSESLIALRPNGVYRAQSADCPKVSYYQADLIVNKRDQAALQDVIKQIMWVCAPKTPLDMARAMATSAASHALTVGQQSVRTTYAAVSEYVRRMARLPGQHNMILVSSGFLAIEQEARYEESALMNLAADSNVTINTLDARGLFSTFLNASDDIQSREPSQVGEYRERELKAAENAMGELAYGTGGNFYHNNNDLEAGFRKLLDAPETTYVLELPLGAVKPDGAYHRLAVNVHRSDTRAQARKGYFAPKPAAMN